MKKVFNILIILLIGLGIWFATRLFIGGNEVVETKSEEQLVGGDKDDYGCIGSAGYTWCEPKNKCLRTWEETCEETPKLTLLIQNLESTLTYPATWEVELTELNSKDCRTINTYSPNYTISDGYPVLLEGALISARICETEETDLKAKFEADSMVNRIAKNIIDVEVGEVYAIQYNYSYEGWNATDTIFIKDSVYYTVKLRYVDEDGRIIYWPTYEAFLSSF